MTSTTAGTPAPVPARGFRDPTRESQVAFRAVMEALARPTRAFPLAGPPEAPPPLGPGLGAVALTLLDEDVSVWLGGALDADAEVAAWLDFHTGARRAADAVDADFVFATPAVLPPLTTLRVGTDESPHLSATVVLDLRDALDGASDRFTARGPGIGGSAELDAPWAARIPGFAAQWHSNTRLFPRGVDLLLVGTDTVSALSRTTRLTPAPTTPTEGEEA